MRLAGGQAEPDREPLRIDERVDLAKSGNVSVGGGD